MTIGIVHISDIHFRNNWKENQGVVLEEFLKDLQKKVAEYKGEVFLVISGDLVLAGGEKTLYESFSNELCEQLDKIGLGVDKRICVPGNHDLDLSWLEENKQIHNGLVSTFESEKDFNDYSGKSTSILGEKFSNYSGFSKIFAKYSLQEDSICGLGFELSDEIGIYCVNSAITSSGNSSSDQHKLCINTREIHEWCSSTKTTTNIFVMHHPVSWLTKWAQDELQIILNKNFKLCLYGHEHDPRYFDQKSNSGEILQFSAPHLFTDKSELLGYSIYEMNSSYGVTRAIFRQWTQNQKFVSGVNFTNNDTGIIDFINECDSSHDENDIVQKTLKIALEKTLKSYKTQPLVWIEPLLYLEKETDSHNLENGSSTKDHLTVKQLIDEPKNIVISAPHQFGMTSLSHWIKYQAWKNKKEFWGLVDLDKVKFFEIKDLIDQGLELSGRGGTDISGIIVDSWSGSDKAKVKSLKKLHELYPDIPLILMRAEEEAYFKLTYPENTLIERDFDYLFLHTLSRSQIRSLTRQYLEEIDIGDEDIVLNKLLSDLETLNLYRTPLNCITLLKVSEVEFDDSPVNRTEVIKRLLFLLFNSDTLPKYADIPDLKDCEHVMGMFCEHVLRSNQLDFTRENFISMTRKFCSESIIDLEVEFLFNLLCSNNIFVKIGSYFSFKYRYWIMYFAAQRMHHNIEFREFIFDGMRYAAYPELMEFYTGIDRRRNDALDRLSQDLKETYQKIVKKMGMPEELNLYDHISWRPSEEVIEEVKEELQDEVRESNLPESIKDKYADRGYNPLKPYDQGIENIADEYFLELFSQLVKASSRALRNSDYADPEKKKELLSLILASWTFMTKILVVLSPAIAEKGSALFEGTRFYLSGEDDKTPEQRFNILLRAIPNNVVMWYANDLYSSKMATLFKNSLFEQDSNLSQLYLAKLLIDKRPQGWRAKIKEYIYSLHKNSYYLNNIQNDLSYNSTFGFVSQSTKGDLIYLRKMAWAKHETGAKRPGNKLISKVELTDEKPLE